MTLWRVFFQQKGALHFFKWTITHDYNTPAHPVQMTVHLTCWILLNSVAL